MFRRILVGVDGSPESEGALRAAIGMAVSVSGEVSVAIVASASHGETDEDRESAFDAEVAPIRASVDQLLAGSEQARCTIHVIKGDRPAEALSAYVESHGYDLLVVGRHGRDHAAHGGLGRVAHELADKATCPLLLIGDSRAATC